MVVRIRLVPVGKKSQRSYQIKVIDSRRHRESGNFLEHLGYWNPRWKKMELNQERYQKWLNWGAQPTDSLNVRYNKQTIIKGLENLPSNQIKIRMLESNFKFSKEQGESEEPVNFQVRELKKKLKENNYWLIKGALLDKWEKGLVEKIFKNNRFRLRRFFSRQGKEIKEKEEISSLSPFNFEFSITLPKEEKPEIIYITKNSPILLIEPKKL